jgi:hypothetical protein
MIPNLFPDIVIPKILIFSSVIAFVGNKVSTCFMFGTKKIVDHPVRAICHTGRKREYKVGTYVRTSDEAIYGIRA